MREALNEALHEAMEDGTWKELYEKWFPGPRCPTSTCRSRQTSTETEPTSGRAERSAPARPHHLPPLTAGETPWTGSKPLKRTFLDFDAMWQVLPQMLGTGLRNTLIISIAATVIGLVLGMVVAIMGISTSRWLRIPARIYTDIFRGLPAILTILLIGQGFARFSQSIVRPVARIRWASWP